MSSALNPGKKDMRQSPRQALQVPVDLKTLNKEAIDSILDGQGYEELQLNSLSLNRPRHGMERIQAIDLSASGLRVRGLQAQPGTVAMLDLHLPDEGVVVKALVEVMWVGQAQDAPVAGLRFAAMQEQGAQRVQTFLRSSSKAN